MMKNKHLTRHRYGPSILTDLTSMIPASTGPLAVRNTGLSVCDLDLAITSLELLSVSLSLESRLSNVECRAEISSSGSESESPCTLPWKLAESEVGGGWGWGSIREHGGEGRRYVSMAD